MAVYVDPDMGSDSTGDGSQGNPYRTREKARTSTSNGFQQVYVKRGTVETVSATQAFRSGTGPSAIYSYGAYGSGAKPILRCASSVTDVAWILGGSQYITIEDWVFDGTGAVARPMNLQSNSANVNDIIFRRCEFSDGGDSTTPRNGFTADGKTAGFSVRGLLLEDCDFYDNGYHGSGCNGDVFATFRRCRSWNNGLYTGAHGFSSIAYTQTPTGWSGGPSIYSKVISETPLQVTTSDTTYPILASAGATTTPSAGQWGFTGGTLYINLNGTNPSGVTVKYAYSTCGPIIYEDCEAFSMPGNRFGSFVEGAGFQLDDFSIGQFRRCYSHDNGGPGFSFNIGANKGSGFACVAARNGRFGLVFQYATGVAAAHFTLVNNARNTYGSSDTSEVSVTQGSAATLSNLLVSTDKTYGIDVQNNSASGTTATNCNIYGASTATNGITPTSQTTVDPQITPGAFLPATTSLHTAGTYLGGLDFYGSSFKSPPTIGAVQKQGAPNGVNASPTLKSSSVASKTESNRTAIA